MPGFNATVVLPQNAQPNWSTTCKLWSRSDLGITQATGVSQWNDQTSNAWHLTQGTGANQPAYNSSDAGYRGRPSLSLDGTDDSLNNASFAVSQPMTLYIVSKYLGDNTQRQLVDASSGSVRAFIFRDISPAYSYGATTAVTSAINSAGPHAFCAVFNGNASSSLYIDNSASTAAIGSPGTSGLTTISLGSFHGASNFWQGTVPEIIVFNVAHNSTQVAQWFKYFAALYGGSWS